MQKTLKLSSLWLASPMLFATSSPLQAQDTTKNSELETIVVTATRSALARGELAGNTAVIDQQSLQQIGHVHIQQSLSRIAGVNLSRGNGLEYLPAVRSPVLTGAGACGSILALADGIPLRAAGFCNLNELFDSQSESAGSIEVVRGPGSAFYGSNAMHGLINVISPAVNGNQQQFGLEFGPDDFLRGKYSGSHQTRLHGLRADVSASKDNGWQQDSGYAQQKVSLRHEYSGQQFNATTVFSATNLNQETAGYITGKNAFSDPAKRSTNPNPEAFRDSQSARLYSRLEWDLSSGDQFTLTPYVRQTKMDFLQHFLPGDPLEQNGHHSLGMQSSYRFEGRINSITLGLDAELTQGYLRQTQDAPTRGSAFLRATIPQGKHYDYRVNARLIAPFIHSEWKLTSDLSATAGLRYEHMTYDYDNRMLDGRTDDRGNACGFGGCRYSRPADRKDSFNNWSPKLGLIWQFNPQQQLYLNLASAFRAPQASELYRLQRAQQVADLESEKLNSVELGYRGEAGKLQFEVLAYLMNKENVIFRDSDFFNVADGKTTHKGIETSLYYPLSSTWDIAVSASVARHRYDYHRVLNQVDIYHNDIDSAPRHFANTRLGWQIDEKLRAELEWQRLGSYYTDPENRHRYDGHNLLNLYISQQLNPALALYARVFNLTNRYYAERADYTGFTGDRYFPGRDRSLYLGVTYSM